jgi:geranylgeranyl reductase family protein
VRELAEMQRNPAVWDLNVRDLNLSALCADHAPRMVRFLTGAVLACGGNVLSRRFHRGDTAATEFEFLRVTCVEMYSLLLAAGLELTTQSHRTISALCQCNRETVESTASFPARVELTIRKRKAAPAPGGLSDPSHAAQAICCPAVSIPSRAILFVMDLWDAIVVGAGPAGCAAAYDLAVAGRRVLLLDRAAFPRPKACAGGLTRKSLLALRYSVAPVIRRTISSIVVEKRAGEAATLASRTAVCAMTVRQELDDFCLKQTLAGGAQFARTGAIAAIEEGAQEVALRADGQTFRARFLVGADGVHSRVRQLLCGDASAWLRRGFALEAQVRDAGDSRLIFNLAAVRQGYAWVFPEGDHLNVGLYTESPAEGLSRERLMHWIHARFGQASVGHTTGQHVGFGAENAPPPRRRVFLAGDAGGFADPLTGEGIHGALASGQAAAAAIDAELRLGTPADSVFSERTVPLRRDLRLSAAGARWFYGNLDAGFRALTAPLLRGAAINAYANGTGIAALANAVKRFARVFAASA